MFSRSETRFGSVNRVGPGMGRDSTSVVAHWSRKAFGHRDSVVVGARQATTVSDRLDSGFTGAVILSQASWIEMPNPGSLISFYRK